MLESYIIDMNRGFPTPKIGKFFIDAHRVFHIMAHESTTRKNRWVMETHDLFRQKRSKLEGGIARVIPCPVLIN